MAAGVFVAIAAKADNIFSPHRRLAFSDLLHDLDHCEAVFSPMLVVNAADEFIDAGFRLLGFEFCFCHEKDVVVSESPRETGFEENSISLAVKICNFLSK